MLSDQVMRLPADNDGLARLPLTQHCAATPPSRFISWPSTDTPLPV